MKVVTGTLANTPIADAAIALVPGLNGQSRVGNNYEIRRLLGAPTSATTKYYTIDSNFEPTDPGWRFWKYFRGVQMANAVADVVFPGENDLVVDTDSMSQLIGGSPQPIVDSFSFGNSPTVHHCNYFRQTQTIAKICEWFGERSVQPIHNAPRARRLRVNRTR